MSSENVVIYILICIPLLYFLYKINNKNQNTTTYTVEDCKNTLIKTYGMWGRGFQTVALYEDYRCRFPIFTVIVIDLRDNHIVNYERSFLNIYEADHYKNELIDSRYRNTNKYTVIVIDTYLLVKITQSELLKKVFIDNERTEK